MSLCVSLTQYIKKVQTSFYNYIPRSNSSFLNRGEKSYLQKDDAKYENYLLNVTWLANLYKYLSNIKINERANTYLFILILQIINENEIIFKNNKDCFILIAAIIKKYIQFNKIDLKKIDIKNNQENIFLLYVIKIYFSFYDGIFSFKPDAEYFLKIKDFDYKNNFFKTYFNNGIAEFFDIDALCNTYIKYYYPQLFAIG